MLKPLRHPRAPLSSDMVVFLGGQLISCQSVNLSATGLGLLSPVPCRVDMKFPVELFLSSLPEWLSLEAELVRQHRLADGGYFWALRYRLMNRQDAEHIDDFVHAWLAESAFLQTPQVHGHQGDGRPEHLQTG